MRVIGTGFGRTGTRSTKDALELGSRAVRIGALAAPVGAAVAVTRRRARRSGGR